MVPGGLRIQSLVLDTTGDFWWKDEGSWVLVLTISIQTCRF